MIASAPLSDQAATT